MSGNRVLGIVDEASGCVLEDDGHLKRLKNGLSLVLGNDDHSPRQRLERCLDVAQRFAGFLPFPVGQVVGEGIARRTALSCPATTRWWLELASDSVELRIFLPPPEAEPRSKPPARSGRGWLRERAAEQGDLRRLHAQDLLEARSLLESHGGQVAAVTQASNGTTVTGRIPRAGLAALRSRAWTVEGVGRLCVTGPWPHFQLGAACLEALQ